MDECLGSGVTQHLHRQARPVEFVVRVSQDAESHDRIALTGFAPVASPESANSPPRGRPADDRTDDRRKRHPPQHHADYSNPRNAAVLDLRRPEELGHHDQQNSDGRPAADQPGPHDAARCPVMT